MHALNIDPNKTLLMNPHLQSASHQVRPKTLTIFGKKISFKRKLPGGYDCHGEFHFGQPAQYSSSHYDVQAETVRLSLVALVFLGVVGAFFAAILR